jgi:hypothetical protein
MSTAERVRNFRQRQKFKQHVEGLLNESAGENLGIHFERAAYALARKAVIKSDPEVFAQQHWGDDEITPLVLRAAQNPAKTTDAGMAPLLVQVVGDFISSLAFISAVAKLFAAAVPVNLDNIHSVLIPTRAGPIDINDTGWVAEGDPILVPTMTIGGVVLGPHKKLASIIIYSRELSERSAAEEIFSAILKETISLKLDSWVLSNQAATVAAPAGLLNGVAPIAGSADMDADLGKLAGAIGSVTSGLAYVGNPAQINAIKLKRGATWSPDIPLIPTVGVAQGIVIAIDPQALAVSFGEPKISVANVPTVQMNDAPTSSLLGAPTVVSLYQIDSVGLRVMLDVAYVIRQAGSVAWVNNATWGS